jgi:hypothetical protein
LVIILRIDCAFPVCIASGLSMFDDFFSSFFTAGKGNLTCIARLSAFKDAP